MKYFENIKSTPEIVKVFNDDIYYSLDMNLYIYNVSNKRIVDHIPYETIYTNLTRNDKTKSLVIRTDEYNILFTLQKHTIIYLKKNLHFIVSLMACM